MKTCGAFSQVEVVARWHISDPNHLVPRFSVIRVPRVKVTIVAHVMDTQWVVWRVSYPDSLLLIANSR